jgi:vancomycin aglycone glucosyltransferase
MKILLAPIGSEGDVRPMLVLATALREAGHQITVCAPPNDYRLFADRGFPFHPLGTDIQVWAQENAGAVMGHPFRGLKPMIDGLCDLVPQLFSGLLEYAGASEFLIASGLNLAAHSVAQALEIPYRHVVHIPQILPSSHHPPAFLPWQGLPRFLNRLCWRASALFLDRVFRAAINIYRRNLGLQGIRNVQDFFVSKVLVAMDKELAPIPPDTHLDYIQTGYWYSSEDEPLDAGLERFIEEGAPPIYIGFGSMTDSSPGKTSRLLVEAVALLGVRAIIGKGWAGLGEEVRAKNIKMIGHAPHASLFPKMAAVIHHGGAGTVYAAARAGVPQVVVPHILDQYYWGRRVHKLGLGPRPIKRSRLTVRNLVSAVQQGISDLSLKEEAQSLASKLRARNGLQEAVAIF